MTTAVEGANAHRAIAHKSMKRYTYNSNFFLGVFEESKGIDSRQSADLSSKISVKCLDTESLEQPTALVSTTLDRSMCNEFLEHLFLCYRRPEEAATHNKTPVYILIHIVTPASST